MNIICSRFLRTRRGFRSFGVMALGIQVLRYGFLYANLITPTLAVTMKDEMPHSICDLVILIRCGHAITTGCLLR